MEVQRLPQKVQKALWLGEKENNFLFAFLETTWSSLILEFKLSLTAFWEAWAKFAVVNAEASGYLVSFQARRVESPCRIPCECKQGAHDVHVLCIHVHLLMYMCVCIHIFNIFCHWVLALNVKITSVTALLGRFLLLGDWRLFFRILILGRPQDLWMIFGVLLLCI